jgi:hypothetical protein
LVEKSLHLMMLDFLYTCPAGQGATRAEQGGAVLPESLPGLWPAEAAGVELATLCSWFDGKHVFQEIAQPGYCNFHLQDNVALP